MFGRQILSADAYSSRDIRTVTLDDPDVFVGSPVPVPTTKLVYDTDSKTFLYKKVNISAAEEKIFKEILSNGSDNIVLTVMGTNTDINKDMLPHRMWTKPDIGDIHVKITDDSISFRTHGNPIPLAPCPDSTPDKLVLPPHLAFGVPFSGTNNDKGKVGLGAGKNGIGAKATNILSTRFIAKAGNNVDGQMFEGEWVRNMEKMSKDSVTPGFKYSGGKWVSLADDKNRYSGENFVEITYFPDTARWKWDHNTYDKICLFAQLVASASFSSRVPIRFEYKIKGKSGKIIFDFKRTTDYLKLFKLSSGKSHEQFFWTLRSNLGQVRLMGATDIKNLSKDKQMSIAHNPMCIEDYPFMELYLYDTPNNGISLSFVNGNETIDGGIHLDAVLGPIVSFIKAKLNRKDKTINKDIVLKHVTIVCMLRVNQPLYDSQSKNKLTSYKEPKLDKKTGAYKLDSAGKPIFDTKEKIVLSDYNPELWFGDWQAFSIIESMFSDKSNVKKLSNTKHLEIKKLEDAFAAHSNMGFLCTLYIVEGDAAKDYPTSVIENFETRDFGGILPIKGKIPNVSKMSTEKKSEIIDELVKAIGLQEDADYTKEEHVRTLRYGYVCCMKDADVDGDHINGLIINLLNERYPSFLRAGRYSYFITPVIRVVKQTRKKLSGPPETNIIARFYNEEDFVEWWKSNEKKGYKVRYLKGLASSTDDDRLDNIEHGYKIVVMLDKNGDKCLYISFGKGMSNMRKRWMYQTALNKPPMEICKFEEQSEYRNASVPDVIASKSKRDANVARIEPLDYELPTHFREVTNIVNLDIINYSLASLERGIPSVMDGLKRSQRQAMWVILKLWNYGKSDADMMKISRLTGSITEKVNYKHGETSMQMTIMKQCQYFTGGNNLPVYMRGGGFGTYWNGGTDMSAGRSRYVATAGELWHSYMFSKEMTKNVERYKEEGEEVESKYIPMLIPIVLINGTKGLATGYCSSIPPHNLYDLIDWYILRCDDQIGTIPLPWFKDFKGSNVLVNPHLEVEEKHGSVKEISELEDLEELDSDIEDEDLDNETNKERMMEFLSKTTGQRLESYGDYKKYYDNFGENTCNVVITQLPIGIYPSTYKKYMLEWEKSGFITGFKAGGEPIYHKASKGGKKGRVKKNAKDSGNEKKKSVPSGVDFIEEPEIELVIFGVNEQLLKINHENLRLKTTICMSNMTLLDHRGCPMHFNNVGSIMNEHYKIMLTEFLKYKKNRLEKIQLDINFYEYKKIFIRLVIDGKIHSKMKLKEWCPVMSKAGIPSEFHDGLCEIKISSIAEDKLDELDRQIAKLKDEYDDLKKKTPNSIYRERLVAMREAFEHAKYPKNENETRVLENGAYDFSR